MLKVRSAQALPLLLALAAASPALAQTAPEPAPAPAPTRALKVGLCAQWLPSNPFAGAAAAGPGVIAVYEFLLTPRFALGLELGLRGLFGESAVTQVVYGAVLKHAVGPGPGAPLRPYLQYGLLQQISRQSGHDGAAVAYDAGLTAGADFAVSSAPLFLEAAFHFSHLSALDRLPLSASYAEVVLGGRFSW